MDSELYKNYRVYAGVDLGAVERNIVLCKERAGKAKVMAVVKADAYGHGAAKVARRIEPLADSFAVAVPEEGIELRKSGITKPILILGETPEYHYDSLFEYYLAPTLYTLAAAKKLSSVATGKSAVLGVHIAVDTGMSRLGFYYTEAVGAVGAIASLEGLSIEGVFSHFSCADIKEEPYTLMQRKRFEEVKRGLKRRKIRCHNYHISNSAHIMESGGIMDCVRAGIMLYGLYPSDDIARSIPLEPAMSLVSHIAFLHTKPAGAGVSYGKTYITQGKTKIATIPVGYADGYPRALSNKARVLIHGKSAPVIGRVCMDQFMADVTAISNVRTGDKVILIGGEGENRITADELATLAGTINYEIVTGISKRVPRVYYN